MGDGEYDSHGWLRERGDISGLRHCASGRLHKIGVSALPWSRLRGGRVRAAGSRNRNWTGEIVYIHVQADILGPFCGWLVSPCDLFYLLVFSLAGANQGDCGEGVGP